MQLEFIDYDLRVIAVELEKQIGMTLEITSQHRIGDPGVHGQLPLRGIDIRCFDDVIGERLAILVNQKWIYDPKRPEYSCAIYHDTGKGKHLHLQSHPRTVRR